MGFAPPVTLWQNRVCENEYPTNTIFISVPPYLSTTICISATRKINIKIYLAKPKTKNTSESNDVSKRERRLEPTQSKTLLLGSSAASSGGMDGRGLREWMGLY